MSGVAKDVPFIVQLHKEVAHDITDGQPERLLGVTMDNTKANRNAIHRLEKLFPTWVNVGCQAHGLALLIKDLANANHSPWTAAVFAKASMMTLLIGGSERVRSLLNRMQMERYGKVRGCNSVCCTNSHLDALDTRTYHPPHRLHAAAGQRHCLSQPHTLGLTRVHCP